jgi:hypothetical protein
MARLAHQLAARAGRQHRRRQRQRAGRPRRRRHRAQLDPCARVWSAGLAPGSPTALRLFS